MHCATGCETHNIASRARSNLSTIAQIREKRQYKPMAQIPVPNPLPAPLPGGGPQDGYQFEFNERYYRTRNTALAALSFGIAASEFPDARELEQEDQTALADKLYDQTTPGQAGFGKDHVDFDEQIDYWRQDPYATMYMRSQVYGYQRVPIGTGNTTQPVEVVNPADLQGPPEKGKYLLVTCDINLL
jgi:hypothetical protein